MVLFKHSEARKWLWRENRYEEYKLPKGKYIVSTDDMEALTTCPHCGKEFPYGECYTSREIHSVMGIGLWVCKDCYTQEWLEYEEAIERGETGE